MLHLPEVFFRNVRNFFSRSKWLIRFLKLSSVTEKEQRPGIILIQIDALSRRQLEAALKTGRMPFLKHLMERQEYSLHTHYSGMPCCTPAVQGELFYGVKSCVPSFSFYRADEQRIYTMFNPPDAESIESELKTQGTGLFEEGSCYSNIYTGGAAEPHFCISDIHPSRVFKRPRTFGFIIAVLLHLYSLMRAGALLVVEFFLAIIDCYRGLVAGRDLWKELKFIPSRVGICVLLREIIVIGAKLDITRGLPVIQLNFMGYHEQSHRRGGRSHFAHWTLQGIDDAVKRVWKRAHRSEKSYEFWVYSDHGQVDTYPYEFYFDQPLHDTIVKTFEIEKTPPQGFRVKHRPGVINRLGRRLQKMVQSVSDTNKDVLVTSLGPLAQIYFANNHRDLKTCAARLMQTGKIPMVLIPEPSGKVRVLTGEAEYLLPDQIDVFKFDNRFVPDSWLQDFIQTCHRPDAGDLIVCGYQGPHRRYLAFVRENGSHGGVTEEEYSGFFLAPTHGPVDDSKGYVRPTDIRNGVLEVLGRSETQHKSRQAVVVSQIRIMTYNVHSCVGMDGRLSPLRIARVIEQFNPDIVALQELDVGRARSEHEDQAQAIAALLKMHHFFFPAIAMEEEQYGDAILSRFPVQLIRSDILPGHTGQPRHEPRGALWVKIDLGDGQNIHIVTTHLGLRTSERQQQVEALLSSVWCRHEDFDGPGVLCGDFNFRPQSKLYRQCCDLFESAVPKDGLRETYCGHRPMIRLDHIFYKGSLILNDCRVADTDLARIASDHRPLIAEFSI